MEGEDHIGRQSHLRKEEEEEDDEEEVFTVSSYAVFIPTFRNNVFPPPSE
jgi:hypothetical protein